MRYAILNTRSLTFEHVEREDMTYVTESYHTAREMAWWMNKGPSGRFQVVELHTIPEDAEEDAGS